MKVLRLVILATVLAGAVAAVACGDDDDDTPTPTITATAAATQSPAAEPTTVAATETDDPEPTTPTEVTDEMVDAIVAYLGQPGYEGQIYDVTDLTCAEIADATDDGGDISDYIGENLVCLLPESTEFTADQIRVGFGPYASEIQGVVVLERSGDNWQTTSIEPVEMP